LNIGMDVSMVVGFGEEARVAELAAKGGEELLAHATEDVVAHGAEDVAEHTGEDIAEHAGGCGGLSFSFNTTVATAAGAQAIGALKVGEKVWAYNPTAKKMELEPIKHVWINHDDDLVDLAISYTTKDKQGHPVEQVDTIHTNKKHPFLTQKHGFTPVAQFISGMRIVRADGSLGTVVAWEVVPGTSTMYNLEIAQDHTYTVSDGHWVVHNCGNTALRDGTPVTITEKGFNHSFDRHAKEWFGRSTTDADKPAEQQVLSRWAPGRKFLHLVGPPTPLWLLHSFHSFSR
jgi:hypothetical protein